MQLKTQEHIDLMAQFEKEHKNYRLDREDKSLWGMSTPYIYQSGKTNAAFLAYRKGYSLAKSIYQGGE